MVPIMRPLSWIPGLNLTWAHNLLVWWALSSLLRVILSRDLMRSLFSLFPLNFFPHFFLPLFLPQFLLFIALS